MCLMMNETFDVDYLLLMFCCCLVLWLLNSFSQCLVILEAVHFCLYSIQLKSSINILGLPIFFIKKQNITLSKIYVEPTKWLNSRLI